MKKTVCFMAVFLALSCGLLSAGGAKETVSPGAISPELEAWLKQAQLGPYAPAKQDWDEMAAKAKAEGKVVVYSASSRIFEAGETFTAKYGIKVEAYDMGAGEANEKIGREQEAGVFNADVLFSQGAEIVLQLMKQGYLYNFVPDYWAPHIPAQYKEPLLVHRLSAKMILYNMERYPGGPPINNIWDITHPEWKNKFLIKNPTEDPDQLGDLVNFTAHSAEMKAAYERKYGKLELSPGVPDAGHEFLYRLLKNGVVLIKSGGDVGAGVGTKGQADPPLGITSLSKIRDNKKGLVLAGATGIDTVDCHVALRYLPIARYAPHPNAAKLFIAWVMGSPEAIGKQLEEPYN
ncbi:MAG: ABC transporter substrate-binding protein, partial [Spirochaetota bacterium]